VDVSRRDIVVAGAMAPGASGSLLGGATGAEAGDEESVAQVVEILCRGGRGKKQREGGSVENGRSVNQALWGPLCSLLSRRTLPWVRVESP
jgi:hypothetical protein